MQNLSRSGLFERFTQLVKRPGMDVTGHLKIGHSRCYIDPRNPHDSVADLAPASSEACNVQHECQIEGY